MRFIRKVYVKRRLPSLNLGEREGIAIATARQWLPTIKSRAQVRRRRSTASHKKRGRVRYRRHESENPLDFALSPERLFLAEQRADFRKIFGPLLEPVEIFRPRRGRLTNAERANLRKIDLGDI